MEKETEHHVAVKSAAGRSSTLPLNHRVSDPVLSVPLFLHMRSAGVEVSLPQQLSGDKCRAQQRANV